jgi:fibronectin-binding autotransporter adhesin
VRNITWRGGARNHVAPSNQARKRRLALLSMACLTALPAIASATTYQWVGGTSGTWGVASTNVWSPTGLPNNGDTANVTNTLGASQTITYNYSGTAVLMANLTVDALGGSGAGVETINMAANNLATNEEYIGYSGSGSGGKALFNQSGGNNNATYLFFGINSGDTGTYVMTGGTLNSPFDFYVGDGGTGALNASGAASITCDQLLVGELTGSNGTASLGVDSSLVATNYETIGQDGTGTFIQSGFSTNTDINGLYLAGFTTGSGNYQLSGVASLSVGTGEFIGEEGVGTFNQSGDPSNSITGPLCVGCTAGATGTFILSGGTVSAGTVTIGGTNSAGGKGVMTVNGGTLTTTGVLTIYNTSGSGLTFSSGSITAGSLVTSGNPSLFNWTGGALTITNEDIEVDNSSSANLPNGQTIGPTQFLNVPNNDEYIGASGTGAMTQTGGANSTAGLMYIGGNLGASGSYTLSGGSLSTVALVAGYFGAGSFTQSGGVATIEILDQAYEGSGTVILSGGTLNAFAEFIGTYAPATFNQTGGVNILTGSNYYSGMTIGTDIGTATYNLSGGTTLVENGGVLVGNVGPNGDNAPGLGVLNITGGTFNITGTNTLSIASYGASGVTLNGGTLELGGLITEGIPSEFNWTSGTLSYNNSATFDSGGTGTLNAFGTSLTLGANQNLTVNGNETLGGTGGFTLTLNSGAYHYVVGSLIITPAGTLTQNAGSYLYTSEIDQDGGTINGFLQNQGFFNYESGAFNGRLINQGTVGFQSNFTAGDGIENDFTLDLLVGQALTINGADLDNLGTFYQGGGTIFGNSTVLNDYGGTWQGFGTINPAFTNDGTLELEGVLRVSGGATNNGIVNGAGTILGAFANNGIVQSSGTIEGAFSNAPAGNVQPAGLLTITSAWTNAGVVTMQGTGSILAGGAITNNSNIQGEGVINSVVTNTTGTILAEGGELELTGAGDTNGTAAQIQAGTASTVLYSQGLATNSGEIALTGGTFDNNGHTITNASTGYISGWGTFRSGGLTNNGFMYIGGNFNAFGPVNNGATGAVNATGAGLNAFFGPVTNNSGGSFTIQPGANVTFFNSYTGTAPVNNSGTVTFAVASTSGPITGGGQTIVGNGTTTKLQLVANGGTSSQTALTINNGSTVDITNNTFFVNYGSGPDPISAIVSYLSTGYAAEKWTGVGIDSSIVANLNVTQSQLIYAIGYADGADGLVNGLSSGEIEIMPTLAGDAKLQGNVVFGDFQVLAQYFGKSGGWDEGNFTYGPKIDFGDFQILAQDFGSSSSALTASEISSLNSFASAFGAELAPSADGVGFQVISVPEPASAGLMILAGGLLARRRRTGRPARI